MTDKLADELWEKYAIDEMVDRDDFLAAIHEYGAAVRKRDAEICRERAAACAPEGKFVTAYDAENAMAIKDCAAAIESDPLP